MRADRLVATLLLMQTRGRVTAAELADELEVSVATARRDLEALSTAGVPVYPQPGRGGGWSLLGGARTDLSGLTAAEAQALFVLVGPAAAVAPDAKAALRKLVRALPETFRADADAAANAVVIDPARWGGHDTQRPDLVAALQSAVVQRRKVRMHYAKRRGQRSERLVSPLGLIVKDEIWYLIAGNRQQSADLPGRPDRRGGGHRRACRTPARLRPARGLAAGRRRGRTVARRRLRHCIDRGPVRARAAHPVGPPL